MSEYVRWLAIGFLRYLSFIFAAGLLFALVLGFDLRSHKTYVATLMVPLFVFFTFSPAKKIESGFGFMLAVLLFILGLFSVIFIFVTSPYGWKALGLDDYVVVFVSLCWLLLMHKFRIIKTAD